MRKVLATVAWIAQLAGAAAACNAILGNEPRMLDEGEAGTSVGDGGAPQLDAGDGGCAADLANDPKNCGACDHDCLGGACNAGKCQPFTLVTGLTQPAHLVVRGGVLYWTSATGAVHSCPVAGCNGQAKLITAIDASNPLPSGLDVRDDTVHVLGYYSAAIDTCPTTGCTAPVRIAQNLDFPEDLHVDETNIYFLSANGGFVGRCRRPSCSGGPVRVASRAGAQVWHELVTDDATLYWVAGPNNQFDKAFIYRAPKTQTDGGPEEIAANVPFPSALAVHAGFLYVNHAGTTIYRIGLAPGLFRTDLTTKEQQAYGMAVDDRYAYWMSSATGAIRRCAITGCSGEAETIVDGQNEPRGPALTDDALYWTEFAGGTVKGLAK